jgi:PAS domain S-box-containing protein
MKITMSDQVLSEIKHTPAKRLKHYFIAVTAILVVMVFFGQIIQDRQRKEDVLHAKRVQNLHKQQVLVTQSVNFLVNLQSTSLMVGIERQKIDEFRQFSHQLIDSRDTLASLYIELEAHDGDEHKSDNQVIVQQLIDKLITQQVSILSMYETHHLNDDSLNQHLKVILSDYEKYRYEVTQFTTILTTEAEFETEQHRVILWWIVISIICAIFAVSLIFYRLVNDLIKQQLKLLNIYTENLENENSTQQKNQKMLEQQAEALLASQMKAESILSSTVDAVITINEQGKIESFNKAAETMFGFYTDFVIGKNVNMLMPEPYASEHDEYLKNYLKTGETKIIGSSRVLEGKRVDGTVFPIELTVTEVPNIKPILFTGIVRDISEWKKSDGKLRQAMNELRETQDLILEEERIAKRVFENITSINNIPLKAVSSWLEPMGTFSGDMILTAELPSGGIRVILCDFTGHGLPAALGAVPVSMISSAMASKGIPIEVLMDELNNKLDDLLPTGIFSCIAVVDLNAERTRASIWNAGLPDVVLINQVGEVKQRFKSNHLPLGVMKYRAEELESIGVDIEHGDSFYLYSDGLTEAENVAGEMFGQDRLDRLLQSELVEPGRLQHIQNIVTRFSNGAPATDDVSLVEIKVLAINDEIT